MPDKRLLKKEQEQEEELRKLHTQAEFLTQQLAMEQRISGIYLEALEAISMLTQEKNRLEYALSVNARALEAMGVDFHQVQAKRLEIEHKDREQAQKAREEAYQKAKGSTGLVGLDGKPITP